MTPLRSRTTYANIASTLALAVAVGGGTAYAAAHIGTSDIKNGAVTTAKLKKNAVTSKKVKNGSLKPVDLAADAFSKRVTRQASYTFTDADIVGSFRSATAACEPGEVLLSGGHQVGVRVDVVASRPASADGGVPSAEEPATGWTVTGRLDDDLPGPQAVTAYVLCGS